MQMINSSRQRKFYYSFIIFSVITFATSTLLNHALITVVILFAFIIKLRNVTSVIILLFSYGALKFSFDTFLSWNLSQILANIGMTIIGLHLNSREETNYEVFNLRVRQSILSILGLFSFFRLLAGNEKIMNDLLPGYDNVGHFSMIKIVAECQSFLSDCEKTGNATPEGYRNYPQYFHYLFSSFFETLENSQQIRVYFLISTAVFLLNLNLSMRMIHSNTFENLFISSTAVKTKGKRKNFTKRRNSKKKSIQLIFLLISFLSITYIHALGYVNMEFSILGLLTMFVISQQSFNKLQVLALFVIATASSASYPLMSLPNTAVLFFIVYKIYKQTEMRIELLLYSLIHLIFLGNMIINNLRVTFGYMTTSGGNILFVLVVGFLLVSYFTSRFRKVDSITAEIRSLDIVDFAFVTYSLYSILLLIYNLFRGESIGYYTQKMSMIVFILAIPVMYRVVVESDLLPSLFELFGLKVIISFLAFLLVFGNPFGTLIAAYKSNFTFVTTPVHYLGNFFFLRQSDTSQSERILYSANLRGFHAKPLFIKSATGPQDTIWVNAIRSTWSTKVESGLQEGLLQEFRRDSLTTVQVLADFEIAVLKE
jgi:hypothetical protein